MMKTEAEAIAAERHDLLTLSETAHALRCSRSHLYNIRNGKFPELPPLPLVLIGHRIVMRRAALLSWLLEVERYEQQHQYASGLSSRWLPADDELEYNAGA